MILTPEPEWVANGGRRTGAALILETGLFIQWDKNMANNGSGPNSGVKIIYLGAIWRAEAIVDCEKSTKVEE